jgi:hypothetical protein
LQLFVLTLQERKVLGLDREKHSVETMVLTSILVGGWFGVAIFPKKSMRGPDFLGKMLIL